MQNISKSQGISDLKTPFSWRNNAGTLCPLTIRVKKRLDSFSSDYIQRSKKYCEIESCLYSYLDNYMKELEYCQSLQLQLFMTMVLNMRWVLRS